MRKPSRSLPDTNVVVRYLIGDDPVLFQKAKRFFDEVLEGGVKAVILESVLAECIYVLTKIYQVPREKAAASLIDILRYKGIANEDRRELIRALCLFSERGLDIVDCILCAKSSGGSNRLFSFDAELNRVARKS